MDSSSIVINLARTVGIEAPKGVVRVINVGVCVDVDICAGRPVAAVVELDQPKLISN